MTRIHQLQLQVDQSTSWRDEKRLGLRVEGATPVALTVATGLARRRSELDRCTTLAAPL
ncbi:hypothetical protein ACFL5O_04395 [Myxococcota bacterium]